MIIMTNLQKNHIVTVQDFVPPELAPQLLGCRVWNSRSDLTSWRLCSGSWLFKNWLVEFSLVLFSGFNFFCLTFFYFCPLGDSQYYMKLTFSKLGIGGIWHLSKNHSPEKGDCPKKSCPQPESCCPTMKSSPQPQRFPPSDLEVQLSSTPLPTASSCLSNCRQ